MPLLQHKTKREQEISAGRTATLLRGLKSINVQSHQVTCITQETFLLGIKNIKTVAATIKKSIVISISKPSPQNSERG